MTIDLKLGVTGLRRTGKTVGARIGLRLVSYTAKEWAGNAGVGKGLEATVQRIPADSFWGEKALEAMEALKRLEQPIQ